MIPELVAGSPLCTMIGMKGRSRWPSLFDGSIKSWSFPMSVAHFLNHVQLYSLGMNSFPSPLLFSSSFILTFSLPQIATLQFHTPFLWVTESRLLAPVCFTDPRLVDDTRGNRYQDASTFQLSTLCSISLFSRPQHCHALRISSNDITLFGSDRNVTDNRSSG